MVEADFKVEITYDAASHFGVRRKDKHGFYLRYCARFVDEDNHSLNFLSLNFENFLEETLWLFPPKNMETRFLQYFFSFPRRPRLLVLFLQKEAIPSGLLLAQRYPCVHRKYENTHYLTKAVKNRHAREFYRFPGILHVLLFAASV